MKLVVPQKGEKERLVELAERNAALVLSQDKEKIKREELRTIGAMNEVCGWLGITGVHRIEAFDISNISGFESVGSMIVYEDGMLVEQVGASQGVVALKEHYHAAVEALERELSRHPKLRIHRMGAFYPAGDEQVIVYEVTGRVVPEGGIPLNVGVVVSNVETALNVLAAVRHQAPVIEKYVTLTGAVRTPKTVKVPLGITVAEALALAGGPNLNSIPRRV